MIFNQKGDLVIVEAGTLARVSDLDTLRCIAQVWNDYGGIESALNMKHTRISDTSPLMIFLMTEKMYKTLIMTKAETLEQFIDKIVKGKQK